MIKPTSTPDQFDLEGSETVVRERFETAGKDQYIHRFDPFQNSPIRQSAYRQASYRS